jgi:hypothetical protein
MYIRSETPEGPCVLTLVHVPQFCEPAVLYLQVVVRVLSEKYGCWETRLLNLVSTPSDPNEKVGISAGSFSSTR